MTRLLRLHKLHATGNDFLVVDALAGSPGLAPSDAVALCDRHRGVGADGLLVLGPPAEDADCSMELLNADGGAAEMTGNGIRCLAWLAHAVGLGTSDHLRVATPAGRRDLDLEVDPARDEVVAATVDMGPVTFDPAAIPVAAASPFDLEVEYHGARYRGDAAGMGNPHLVLFVDDPATARVVEHGRRFECDARFPQRTNVEFVAVTAPDEITMRVWERGVGETLSCGTGACAAAAVVHRRGLTGDAVVVHVAGGDLRVDLGTTVRLGGPVRPVFAVEVDLNRLHEGRA